MAVELQHAEGTEGEGHLACPSGAVLGPPRKHIMSLLHGRPSIAVTTGRYRDTDVFWKLLSFLPKQRQGFVQQGGERGTFQVAAQHERPAGRHPLVGDGSGGK